ncbi:ATP-dependent RNA helicase DDX19A-like [Ornithodoros turicata]|uniref:ATP-dependent RNA helicase DDX19A-like n=1 Tax=Ornithodoros turicata TaxID=34597 RepID=UPI003139EDDB
MSGWGAEADAQEQGLQSVTNKIDQVNLRGADGAESDEPELSSAEASLIQKLIRSKLVKTTNDVEVQRRDPSSPLYSVKTFEELKLRPELLKGVYDVGFDLPSKIQETALPTLLADPPQNMIAQSQSGTGKTAAFILASLSRVDESCKYPQVVILSPTYELAIQTGEVAKQMAKFTQITFTYAVRGATFERGHTITEHVILGTPGKIIDWALKFKFFDLNKVKVFVLDEADVMIAQQGHHDQSIRIHKKLPESCQMMLFSATYDKEVMEFAEQIIPNPVMIRLRREEESLENIKQYYVLCSSVQDKFNALSNIYGGLSIGQTIIFCHTRKTAMWLSEQMTKEGHAVALLSGELAIEQRVAVLERFRRGRDRVLITTNVCARGIDIEQVTVVVNFDLPVDQQGRADCETYLHRIGRTGRFGKAGLAINMVDGARTLALVQQIEDHFGRPIRKLDTDDLDEIEKIQK